MKGIVRFGEEGFLADCTKRFPGFRILKASHAEPAAIPFNLQLERQGVVDVSMLERVLNNKVR